MKAKLSRARAAACFRVLQLLFLAGATLFLAGCPVHQKPGVGTQFTLTESETKRKYYLYLPAGYDISRSWPLVLTIHGFNPTDSAERQIREWQSTADKYGLIVIAPDVASSGPMMVQFRFTGSSPSARKDEKAIVNLLDYVLEHTTADPERIMISAWSTGGFLMHYIANRHPDRFAALCSRGSCFNSAILEEKNARQMGERDFPVMIFYGRDDGFNIKIESDMAISWYKKMGCKVENLVIPQKMIVPGIPFGHDRQPELAAQFFTKVLGLSTELKIQASAQSGPAPMAVAFRLELPHQLAKEKLNYYWTIDGEFLARTAEVQTSILRPGLHSIRVVVTNRQGRALTASQEVTVLPSGT